MALKTVAINKGRRNGAVGYFSKKGLKQWFSKCVPLNSSISTTWDLAKMLKLSPPEFAISVMGP